MATLTTICVTGFPPEAQARELKNLARFMQGFEGAHVAFANEGRGVTSLFAKFVSPAIAGCAIEALNGIAFDIDVPGCTLKAEWARREMEVRGGSALPAHLGAANRGAAARPPPSYQPLSGPLSGVPQVGPALTGGHSGYVQAISANRTGATGGELVTITILGISEKRMVLEDLLSWFQQRPGFVALQVNERIDAIFARFVTSVFAEQCIHDANAMGFGAEWARRNLDDDIGAQNAARVTAQPAAYVAAPYAPAPAGPGGGGGGYAAAPAPPRGQETLVTITILGMREKGLSSDEMQNWFTSQPGFVAMQANQRIDGLFVKYATQQLAMQVMSDGNQKFGFGAEWARRNLDDDKSQSQQQQGGGFHAFAGAAVGVAPQLHHASGQFGPAKRQRTQTGELDTICILSMKEKGLAPSDVQQWFQELPGFVAMQVNERIDGLFVKFNNRDTATQALEGSNSRSLGAEWARRNLDL